MSSGWSPTGIPVWYFRYDAGMRRLEKPTRLGVALGTPVLLIAVGIYLWLAERSVLHCDRPAGVATCRLDSARTFKTTSQTLPPESLLGAELEEYTTYDSQDHTTTTHYRVLLLTTTGKRPLNRSTNGGWSRSATQENVRLINTFVRNPQQATLDIGQDNRMMVFFGVMLLGILGIWLMFNMGY